MSNEYYAVILEFNCLSVKLGFAHEAREHVCIDARHSLWSKYITKTRRECYPAFLDLSSHCLDQELKHEIGSILKEDPSYLTMLAAYTDDNERHEWYEWGTDGYVALSQMVRHLLSTSLLISPSKCKLFVVDSGLSAISKDRVCAALFKFQTCVSATFLSLPLSVTIASGMRNALVVDLGWDSCKVSLVVDLRILKSEHIIAFSHETAHYKFALSCNAASFNEIEEAIRDISTQRDFSLEALSFQELPNVLAKMIRKTAIDNRPLLAQNVIITGSLAGFGRVPEVILRDTDNAIATMNVHSLASLGAWSGASLYCSTILLKEDYNNWRHIQISHGQLDTKSNKELERYLG